MKRLLSLLWLPVAALTLAGATLADDGGLLRCRGIADASARLACYDALAIPPSGAQAAPAKPAVAPEQFGMEQQFLQAGAQSIESYIPGRFEGWDRNVSIRLANGQVWQIIDDSKRAFNLVDPKVTVRRGIFGAFYMDFEGYNFAPKVKRVQ